MDDKPENNSEGTTAVQSKPAASKPAAKPTPHRPVQELPKWNVVLLNDDDHSYDYVIEMLVDLFSHSVETAFQMAKKVDTDERVIVLTTHKEYAELKCAQILAYGADPRIGYCKGSMRAVIERAP